MHLLQIDPTGSAMVETDVTFDWIGSDRDRIMQTGKKQKANMLGLLRTQLEGPFIAFS